MSTPSTGLRGRGHRADGHKADVVDLASVRARDRSEAPVTHGVRRAFTHLEPGPEAASESRTVVLQARCVRAGAEVYRQLGIDDGQPLERLGEVIAACFGFRLPAEQDPDSGEIANPHFCRDAEPVDASLPIARYLALSTDELTFHWGLWQVALPTFGSFARDAHTPTALCIGGSGSFTDEPFDPAVINAELTGLDTMEHILGLVLPELAQVIRRSKLTDFIPLIQALDVEAPAALPPATIRELRRLPLESLSDAVTSTDAFWSCALAESCLSDPPLAREVAVTTMAALGHGHLAPEEIQDLCRDSLEVLARAGGCGPNALPTVERIEVYRALFRRW